MCVVSFLCQLELAEPRKHFELQSQAKSNRGLIFPLSEEGLG